jgi:hypothetical protein
MDAVPSHFLLLHGAIVLLAGTLAGFPFWVAVVRKQEGPAIRAWRVAHVTPLMTGLVMIAAGMLQPQLALGPTLHQVFAGSLVAAGYGFSLAMIAGAAFGVRGLTPFRVGITALNPVRLGDEPCSPRSPRMDGPGEAPFRLRVAGVPGRPKGGSPRLFSSCG